LKRKNQPRECAVIGLGRFGSSLARRLEALGQAVLGIEIDPGRAKEIADKITEVAILDATDPEALQQVDITSFKMVVVAIEEDFEANALITSSLKNMGISHVICQAGSPRHREILLRIGADRVVIPKEESGIQLAEELSTPGMLYRLPLSPDFSLIEIQAPAGIITKTVKACEPYEISILLILRGENLLITPDEDVKIQQGDVLVIVGEQQRLIEFSTLI
jgi:trk system potassium uptake protein